MVTETFTTATDWVVPDDFTPPLTITAIGEDGNDAGDGGGDGNTVVGELTPDIGETLYVRFTSGGSGEGSGGGNAADVRQGGTTLSDRVIVGAGGGGDAFDSRAGGDAGHPNGVDGFGTSPGLGGTQTAGGAGGGDGTAGAFGIGGDGGTTDTFPGGGGGAGWYGGGGGGSGGAVGSGGGGGASYIDGVTNTSVTVGTSGTTPRVEFEYTSGPPPENVQIVDTTATSNTLDWTAPTPPTDTEIDEYQIYRDTDTGGFDRADYTLIDATPTVGYQDTGLDNGTTYHYRVGIQYFEPIPEYQITITDFRGV